MFQSFTRSTILLLTLGLAAAACTSATGSFTESDEAEVKEADPVVVVRFEAGDEQWGKTVLEIKSDGTIKHTDSNASSEKVEKPLGKTALASLKSEIASAAAGEIVTEVVPDDDLGRVFGKLEVRTSGGVSVVIHAVESADEGDSVAMNAPGDIGDLGGGTKLRVTKNTSPSADKILARINRIVETKMSP